MFINLEDLYKDRLETIWNNQIDSFPETQNDSVVKLRYAIERELKVGDILFLGMNPSYKPGEWNNNGGGFYNIEPKNTYFQAIYDFCHLSLGLNFISHHDILFVRHTNQKEVEQMMNRYEYQVFFDEQLKLSKEIIQSVEPRLIVVLNAGVRNLFKQIFPFDYENIFDDELGAYVINIGKKVPVIFTGMLTGQRAIDLGTKRSLIWQIQRIIKLADITH